MKRTTHLMLGAAVALPIAVPLSPGLAAGCIWWGMVGGGFPDWFDLRSELRGPLRLRHRGASHGIPFAAMLVAGLWIVLTALAETTFTLGDQAFSLSASAVQPWSLAFALGFASHVMSDALTHAGVRPLLPFSARRVWLLPKLLRGRSSGPLDRVVRYGAFLALIVGGALYLATSQ
jgi:membrane-bound metal-dependent hydrolase YbcI (DUF457 family)